MAWYLFLYLLLLLTDLCGLALTIFTLPGLWLMLGGAALYALFTHAQFLGWHTLVVLLVLALGAEVGEFVLGGAGAKKAGASRWGMAGGIVGAILGGIFLTGFIPIVAPISTVIGICLGSFGGAFAIELAMGRPVAQSLRIGVGAAKGRFVGIVGKFAVGVAMLVLTLAAAWPHRTVAPPPAMANRPTAVTTQPAANPTQPTRLHTAVTPPAQTR